MAHYFCRPQVIPLRFGPGQAVAGSESFLVHKHRPQKTHQLREVGFGFRSVHRQFVILTLIYSLGRFYFRELSFLLVYFFLHAGDAVFRLGHFRVEGAFLFRQLVHIGLGFFGLVLLCFQGALYFVGGLVLFGVCGVRREEQRNESQGTGKKGRQQPLPQLFAVWLIHKNFAPERLEEGSFYSPVFCVCTTVCPRAQSGRDIH